MINEILKKIREKSQQIQLTKAEKDDFRKALQMYMKKNPVRNAGGHRHSHRRSSQFSFLYNLTNTFMSTFNFLKPWIVLPALLLFGTGMTFAAEGSLPGDLLYPVKTQVNEPVMSMVAVGTEQKAKVETKFADRRLAEAEKLAAKGQLKTEHKNLIVTKFDQHAKKATEFVAELEQENNLEAAHDVVSNFSLSLQIHMKVLLALQQEDDNTGEGEENTEVEELTEELAEYIEEAQEEAEETKDELEEDIAEQPASEIEEIVEEELEETEDELEEARDFVVSVNNSVSAEVKADANNQLNVATTLISQVEIKLDQKMFAQAFTLLHQAHIRIEVAKSLVQIQQELSVVVQGSEIATHFEPKDEMLEEEASEGDESESDEDAPEGEAEDAPEDEAEDASEGEAEDASKGSEEPAEEWNEELEAVSEPAPDGGISVEEA